MRRGPRSTATGVVLAGVLLAGVVEIGVAATPATASAPARKAPNACAFITDGDVSVVTGAGFVEHDKGMQLDQNRAGYCYFVGDDGWESGEAGFGLAVVYSKVRAGRSYVEAYPNFGNDFKFKRLPGGPGDRSQLAKQKGTRVLLVRDGPRTLAMIVQRSVQGSLTDDQIEGWLVALAEGALGGS